MGVAKNLVGEIFGRLVVVERAPNRKRAAYWHCRCDCGEEKTLARSALTSGNTTSCGCLRREIMVERGRSRFKDMMGLRFGRLEVVGAVPDSDRGQRVWLCRCDCGNEHQVQGSVLRNGSTQSCGCLASELTSARTRKIFSLPEGVAAFNDLLSRYKRQARQRGYTFELTKQEFRALVTAKCHYCGDGPLQVVQARYGRNGGVTYNGVDRQDNSKGYEIGNVVPCCGLCNRAKMDMSVKDFTGWAKRIAERT